MHRIVIPTSRKQVSFEFPAMFKRKSLFLTIMLVTVSLISISQATQDKPFANLDSLVPIRNLLDSRIESLQQRGLFQDYKHYHEKKLKLEQEYDSYVRDNLFQLAISYYKKEALNNLIEIYEIDHPMTSGRETTTN